MKTILALCVTMLFVNFLHAQINFSGTWAFKSKTHISGPEYANALFGKLSISQNSDSLLVDGFNEDNVKVSHQAFAMNSKSAVSENAGSNRRYTKTLSWAADKKSLILTTLFSIPGNQNKTDFTRVERWTIVNGQLNINKKSVETRSENWEVNGLYAKE